MIYRIVCLLYTIYFFIVMVGSYILFSIPIEIARPFLGTKKQDGYAVWANYWAATILWLVGLYPKISGKMPLDKSARIYLFNHQSQLDILIALAVLPPGFLFVAKEELFRIPFLGHSMRRCGYISIKRNQARKAAETLDHLKELVKQGRSILIFPEGTRSLTGEIGPVKRGSLVLAFESKTPSIPVVLNPAYQIMPKGSVFLRPMRIKLTIGKPIVFDWEKEPDYKQQANEIHTLMGKLLETLKR